MSMAGEVLYLTGKKKKTSEQLVSFLKTGELIKSEVPQAKNWVAVGLWNGILIYALANYVK